MRQLVSAVLYLLFSYLVAIGTESGDIRLFEWSLDNGWKSCIKRDKKYPYVDVLRINFRFIARIVRFDHAMYFEALHLIICNPTRGFVINILVYLNPLFRMLHTGTVTRIRWRPGYTNDSLYLASSSTDNCVRIFEVKLPWKIQKEVN